MRPEPCEHVILHVIFDYPTGDDPWNLPGDPGVEALFRSMEGGHDETEEALSRMDREITIGPFFELPFVLALAILVIAAVAATIIGIALIRGRVW